MAKRKRVNDMKYHYTYRITNIKERMYYYGVHSCDCLPKEDIGIKYWSTSKRDGFIVHQKQNPEQYKYKVIKIFSTRVEAVEHEIILHKKFDVKLHEKFYNDANQTSTGFDTTGKEPWNKGLTKENNDKLKYLSELNKGELNPMYGKTHTKEVREIIKITSTGRTHTMETKDNIKIALEGVKRSAEVCANISKGRTGIKYSDDGKRKLRESKKLGKEHVNTNYIEIYNEKDELVYVCTVEFNLFCKENNLPYTALKASYKTGLLVYSKSNKSSITLLTKSSNIKYKDWKAVNKGKCVDIFNDMDSLIS